LAAAEAGGASNAKDGLVEYDLRRIVDQTLAEINHLSLM